MFFQICLLAAGIQLGRTLLKEWQEEERSDEAGPPPSDAPAAPSSAAATDPNQTAPDRPAGPDGDASPQAALQIADSAAREQTLVALVSTGLAVTPPAQGLGGVGVVYGSIPIFKRAAQLLLIGRLGIEVLDSISLLASVAARQFALSSFFLLFYSVAQSVRTKTEREAYRGLRELFQQRPRDVWILRDGTEVSVPLSELGPGDIGVVDAGSAIPVDGVVVHGSARIDQHLLTGSSDPVDKGAGDTVFSTTVVLSGQIQVRVTASGQQTTAAEVSRLLQRTADFASTVEKESKKVADSSVVPILALSALSARSLGPERTLALLSVNTADNMRMVAPYSMLKSLRTAYEQGFLLKDGRALQLLTEVDTVVFAKTGTLTQGQLQVSQIHAVHGVREDDLLSWAAAAESRQAHPIARAIVSEALRRSHVLPPSGEIHLELGYGISATLGQRTTRIGSQRFMELHGIAVPESLQGKAHAVHGRGRSLVYVAQDRSLLGLIELEPVLRPEVAEVLRALRRRNHGLYLLSGDEEAPTRALAEQLRLDDFTAQVLPGDKARIVHQLQQSGRKVCFVGDGITDAQALKQATVSISMGGASTVAMDSAQVVLMDGGLRGL